MAYSHPSPGHHIELQLISHFSVVWLGGGDLDLWEKHITLQYSEIWVNYNSWNITANMSRMNNSKNAYVKKLPWGHLDENKTDDYQPEQKHCFITSAEQNPAMWNNHGEQAIACNHCRHGGQFWKEFRCENLRPLSEDAHTKKNTLLLWNKKLNMLRLTLLDS